MRKNESHISHTNTYTYIPRIQTHPYEHAHTHKKIHGHTHAKIHTHTTHTYTGSLNKEIEGATNTTANYM